MSVIVATVLCIIFLYAFPSETGAQLPANAGNCTIFIDGENIPGIKDLAYKVLRSRYGEKVYGTIEVYGGSSQLDRYLDEATSFQIIVSYFTWADTLTTYFFDGCMITRKQPFSVIGFGDAYDQKLVHRYVFTATGMREQ